MIVIRDIEPKAKRHFLLIPKKHFKLLSEMTEADADDLGACLKKIPELSDLLGLEGGYRLVINQGDDAGPDGVPSAHSYPDRAEDGFSASLMDYELERSEGKPLPSSFAAGG